MKKKRSAKSLLVRKQEALIEEIAREARASMEMCMQYNAQISARLYAIQAAMAAAEDRARRITAFPELRKKEHLPS